MERSLGASKIPRDSRGVRQKLYVMRSHSRGVLVTGTDTGVGKTWVAARLIRDLRRQGEDPRPLKPVESGCVEVAGTLRARDAEVLRAAARLAESEPVALRKLRAPIAPMLAARREGVPIWMRDLIDFCHRDGALVVEGAGGWRTPLAEDGDAQSLAMSLGLPVLVVVEDRLGAINQGLLTCEAVRESGARLAGVVLNRIKSKKESFGNFPVLEGALDGTPIWRTGPGVWLDERRARHLISTFLTIPAGR